MTVPRRPGPREVPAVARTVARTVVECLGGRYSSELGIDVDAGDADVERWFLAATLFGTRISAGVAARTFTELSRAGVNRVTDAAALDRDRLVELLDAGGYARYDFSMSARLQALAAAVSERYGGGVAGVGREVVDPQALVGVLDALPGWGPVTVGLFLRELRGVWPGARPPIDPRAAEAARHLGLISGSGDDVLAGVVAAAARARLDERDLESGLVRLALAHRRVRDCPGGASCAVLAAPGRQPDGHAPPSPRAGRREADASGSRRGSGRTP